MNIDRILAWLFGFVSVFALVLFIVPQNPVLQFLYPFVVYMVLGIIIGLVITLIVVAIKKPKSLELKAILAITRKLGIPQEDIDKAK